VEVRHRLLEFLVTEMGFNGLVLEASESDLQVANEYVLHGIGSREKILTDLGILMWDTEEFSIVMDWMRDYNRSLRDSERVSLCGMDNWPNRCGRENVLRYLERVAPERLDATQKLFGSLAEQEMVWPAIAADPKNEEPIKELLPQLRELQACLAETRETLIQMSSAEELEEVRISLERMEHWMMANMSEFVPASFPKEQGPKNLVRSRYMAENVRSRLERSPPGTKLVVWAHNYHLEIGLEMASVPEIPNMGSYLKEWYGDGYYSLGLEFNRGGYLSRKGLPEYKLGDFNVGVFESPRPDSLPAVFAETGLSCFLIDLRTPVADSTIEEWLSSRQVVHTVSWYYKDPEISYTEITVGKRRNGILFIDRVNATQPTAGALESAAARRGL
jgi:erythromycin esterase